MSARMSSSLSEFSCGLGVAPVEAAVAAEIVEMVGAEAVVTDNGVVGREIVAGLNLCSKFVPCVGVL